LQGFPDDFQVLGKKNENYEQAGNAVNVNVIKALLDPMVRVIGASR
jgi:site-specific DNA-cytosine methylase